jgi:hypothetical protein
VALCIYTNKSLLQVGLPRSIPVVHVCRHCGARIIGVRRQGGVPTLPISVVALLRGSDEPPSLVRELLRNYSVRTVCNIKCEGEQGGRTVLYVADQRPHSRAQRARLGQVLAASCQGWPSFGKGVAGTTSGFPREPTGQKSKEREDRVGMENWTIIIIPTHHGPSR